MPSATPDSISGMYPRDLLGAEMLFDVLYTAAE